ncbi:hypothetical protein [Streptodolium elevatio]
MGRTVLFVHGTGVRATAFRDTFELIRRQLGRLRPGIDVRGCYWGDEAGARLALDGASVPGYADRGRPTPQEDEIALWAALYADPAYELRLLGLQAPPDVGATRSLPPRDAFLAAVRGYRASPETVAAFRRRNLEEAFEYGLHQIRACPELAEAAETIDVNGYEHRHAVARATVAATLAIALENGANAVDGVARDSLLAAVSADLHTQGRALGGPVKRVAAVAATAWMTRRRTGITDRSGELLGDILRYQARSGAVHEVLRREIAAAQGDQVTLLAHSLGGVASVDLLVKEELPRVDQLITVGSQAPYLYELGALVSVEHPAGLPGHFPRRWLNVYDERDLLSYAAATVFPGRAYDHMLDNGQPFPASHSAYWSNAKFWDAVDTWLI